MICYVPGQLEIKGNFKNNEVDFAVWIAKNNCHGMLLTDNLAIAECNIGREEEFLGELSATRPLFISSISRVEILPERISI